MLQINASYMLDEKSYIAPSCEEDLAKFVADSYENSRKLNILGGATRVRPRKNTDFFLTTRKMNKIVAYEPDELTLIVEAGAAVNDIEAMLLKEGQALSFEPMDYRYILASNGIATMGGMVAANVSGPRRIVAGACRDHVLGVRFVDGQGHIIKNGGRVMKNVTGLDLSKFMSGSYGTLGILTEIVLKTLPIAEAEITLIFENISVNNAITLFAKAMRTPFEVSGAAFYDGVAYLRIEGFKQQATYRYDCLTRLFKDHIIDTIQEEDSKKLWRNLRDVYHFSYSKKALWRIYVKPSDAANIYTVLKNNGGDVSLDWAGGLLWYCGDDNVDFLQKIIKNGVISLIRPASDQELPIFLPLTSAQKALEDALLKRFDPAGIFNPGLLRG